MNKPYSAVNRRQFLQSTSLATAAVSTFGLLSGRGAESPSNTLTLGVIGVSRNSSGGDGRGTELAVDFARLPGVRVKYVCDVDERNVPKAAQSVVTKAKQEKAPEGIRDFRRMLEDKEVDAVVIATPDHWHTPATMLAMAAGKHVYLEKPCSHNAEEGEMLVASARKHQKVVQHGTQRRSWPGIREAVEKLQGGTIGRVLFGKCLYFGPRASIGNGKEVPVPSWLDYSLWQGPAPERPFRDNLVHYNWHWFWHWGTSELGNNAVHYLDVLRWGMGVGLPRRVSCSGGKYRFPDDDQETPDTTIASFDFGGATINWEQRSWAPRTPQDPRFEMAFYGDQGVLTINGGGYTITDLKGAEIAKGTGEAGNRAHLQNFIDAIRNGTALNAEIDEGRKSTLMCHLANIAYRTGQTVTFDAAKGTMSGGRQTAALWGREYRKGWQPKV